MEEEAPFLAAAVSATSMIGRVSYKARCESARLACIATPLANGDPSPYSPLCGECDEDAATRFMVFHEGIYRSCCVNCYGRVMKANAG